LHRPQHPTSRKDWARISAGTPFVASSAPLMNVTFDVCTTITVIANYICFPIIFFFGHGSPPPTTPELEKVVQTFLDSGVVGGWIDKNNVGQILRHWGAVASACSHAARPGGGSGSRRRMLPGGGTLRAAGLSFRRSARRCMSVCCPDARRRWR
jgi:hypothetical protein